IVSVDNFLLLSAKISANHISSSVSNYYTNNKKKVGLILERIYQPRRGCIYIEKRMCFEALAHVFLWLVSLSNHKNCDSAQFIGQ
ncbi:MAG: hypothetical protein II815_02855, partial [Bacteroidales bacterium]|nr:hypothetical protein [Bacteroidales bacterium]